MPLLLSLLSLKTSNCNSNELKSNHPIHSYHLIVLFHSRLQSAASDQLNSLREQGRAVVQHEIGKRKVSLLSDSVGKEVLPFIFLC